MRNMTDDLEVKVLSVYEVLDKEVKKLTEYRSELIAKRKFEMSESILDLEVSLAQLQSSLCRDLAR